MIDWLLDSVLAFIDKYGFLAVFVYMVLETAFILHFAPSEIVIPVAASQLVTNRATFALFVVDTTLGATLGAMLAYYCFGIYGERALERYGRYLHVDQHDLERGQRWFRRWGETSVFWGRMLPVVRAIISIPAGMAEMGIRKFVLYSAVGSAAFNLAFTWLVYSGDRAHSPLDVIVMYSASMVESTLAQPHLAAGSSAVVLVMVGVVWTQRERIRLWL